MIDMTQYCGFLYEGSQEFDFIAEWIEQNTDFRWKNGRASAMKSIEDFNMLTGVIALNSKYAARNQLLLAGPNNWRKGTKGTLYTINDIYMNEVSIASNELCDFLGG